MSDAPPKVAVARTADHRAIAEFLARDVGANAFLLGWLDAQGTTASDQFVLLVAKTQSRICAVALLGRVGVLCTSHGSELDGHEWAAQSRGRGITLTTVLGATAVVDGVLASIEIDRGATILAQRVYVLSTLPADAPGQPSLRLARSVDEDAIFDASLAMHLEEVGKPVPDARRAQLRRSVITKIGNRQIWCLFDDATGRLVFKAGVGASCRSVAQLEGVWVPPDLRRRGIARRCVAELCGRLLRTHGVVSLYVGLENTPARDLYAALGFQASTPFTSALLS